MEYLKKKDGEKLPSLLALTDHAALIEQAIMMIEDNALIPEELMEQLGGAKLAISQKVDHCIGFRKTLENQIQQLEDMGRIIKEKVAARKKLLDNYDGYLKFVLESNDKKLITGASGLSIAVQKNSMDRLELSFDRRYLLEKRFEIVDESLLQTEPTVHGYLSTLDFKVLNKEMIGEHIKLGIELSWAKLTSGTHVRIR